MSYASGENTAALALATGTRARTVVPRPRMLAQAQACGRACVSFSFGLRRDLVARAHAGGSRVLVEVASADAARAVSLRLLAAGGIADPASARAARAAGGAAVVMGTRFVASDECDAHPQYQTRLLEVEGRDTVWTGLFDGG